MHHLIRGKWFCQTSYTDAEVAISMKLRRLRKALRTWERRFLGEATNRKKGAMKRIEELEQLEEIRPLDMREQVELDNLRRKIEEIYQREDIKWKQRARSKWLEDGDANIAFFRKSASMHRRLNTICMLRQKESVNSRCMSHNTSSNCLAQTPWRFHMMEGMWHQTTKLSDLEEEFSEEEVRATVWGLCADISLGPDGFHIGFFRIFWNIVKDDLMRLLKEVWRNSARLDCLNFSFITLIPKMEVPECIGDYKPIALLNSLLKILAKVLANRLAPKPQEFVGKEQTGFIAG